MSEVWNTLIKIQDRLIERFDATGTDPAIINDVIPTFFINVEPAENNPNLNIDIKQNLRCLVV